MSDRVMVMYRNRSNGILDIAEATQERIMALATGIASVEQGGIHGCSL
jgi:ABC-type sugar transport system ATPase subunit